jgi:hypothetical protein
MNSSQTLSEINGQQAAIDRILGEREARKEVFVLSGPLGSGVTWTLSACGVHWESEGGAALEAKGESFASERRLFPWLTMALPKAKKQARLEVLKSTLAQGGRAVPVVGAVTSYLVEEVLNHQKHRLAREALLLTEQEQDLLFVIQTTAQDKQLLLTIDQPEIWDDASWSLLGLILSNKLDELYPAIADALIVIGVTDQIPVRLAPLLSMLPTTELKIRLLNVDEVAVALSAFGFPAVNRHYQKILYDLTNGRLDLLNEVGQQFQQSDLANLSTGWSDYYSGLVTRRISGLRDRVREIEDTLTAAAIIGESFSYGDIACLTGSARDVLTTTLELASREHLISSTGQTARFNSAELHSYFHRAGQEEHSRYHTKFAECIRLMRPGDYGYRAQHLLLAGNTEDALTCYAQAALAARREYRSPSDPGDLATATGWADVRRFLDRMLLALDAYDDQRITEGLDIVDGIEAFLPEPLIAERDYLRGVLLLALPSVRSYDQARLLLQRWSKLADRETELWARMAQSLMVAQAQTDHIEEARRLEAQLTAKYWERRQIDPWALHALNVLRRRSECLHSLPTATQRLESAIAYFGPATKDSVPRHPLQYYYTLTNLIGNQLAGARFGEALTSALLLEELIGRSPSLSWPAPEVAANNAVLARYLAEDLDVATARELLLKVTSNSNEAGDRILLQNNCAILSIHAGQLSEARATLQRSRLSLLESDEPDQYHEYFVNNNLAGLLALTGDIEQAQQLMDLCKEAAKSFYPAISATIMRRQELIGEAINEAANLSVQEFDTYLIRKYGMQVGPQWSFYGRGFLLSDIQYWSAD